MGGLRRYIPAPPPAPSLQDALVKRDLLLGGRLAPAPLLQVTFALICCTFSFPIPLSHIPGISQSQQKLLTLGSDLTSGTRKELRIAGWGRVGTHLRLGHSSGSSYPTEVYVEAALTAGFRN